MKVVLIVAVGIAGIGTGAWALDQDGWLTVGIIVVAAGIVYQFGRCSHQRPLALLPASVDINGEALPPRWYCDHCGKEWPAHFDKDRVPIQRFTGYDESKAVSAAKRADQLRERRRLMAIERAGLGSATRQRKPAQARAPRSETVVNIGTRRPIAR
jgi:hypothetical protein